MNSCSENIGKSHKNICNGALIFQVTDLNLYLKVFSITEIYHNFCIIYSYNITKQLLLTLLNILVLLSLKYKQKNVK